MKYCDCCEREMAVMACDYCSTAVYCSEKCMKDQYKFHKFDCPPPDGLRPVDYLIRDVWQSRKPTENKTLRDYGFINCKRSLDSNFLLGLYSQLIKWYDVTGDELHQYCMKNQIAELIHKTYAKLAVLARGEFYAWFRGHEYIVKNGYKMEEDTADGKADRDDDSLTKHRNLSNQPQNSNQPEDAVDSSHNSLALTTNHRNLSNQPQNSNQPEDAVDSSDNSLATNLQDSSNKPRNSKNKKFSFKDGNNTINYGYNDKPFYYYFNIQDSRLASNCGSSKGVDKVAKHIDSSGSGILFQLHTCLSHEHVTGHLVALDTFAECLEKYNVRRSHINKVKQRKPL